MSIHEDRGAFVVRWRRAGQQRSKRFPTRPEAEAFEGDRAEMERRNELADARARVAAEAGVAIGWVQPDLTIQPGAPKLKRD